MKCGSPFDDIPYNLCYGIFLLANTCLNINEYTFVIVLQLGTYAYTLIIQSRLIQYNCTSVQCVLSQNNCLFLSVDLRHYLEKTVLLLFFNCYNFLNVNDFNFFFNDLTIVDSNKS